MVSSKEILDSLLFRVQQELLKENVLIKFYTQEEVKPINPPLIMFSLRKPLKKKKDKFKITVWVELNNNKLFSRSETIEIEAGKEEENEEEFQKIQETIQELYHIILLDFMVYGTRQLLAGGYGGGEVIGTNNLDIEVIEEL